MLVVKIEKRSKMAYSRTLIKALVVGLIVSYLLPVIQEPKKKTITNREKPSLSELILIIYDAVLNP